MEGSNKLILQSCKGFIFWFILDILFTLPLTLTAQNKGIPKGKKAVWTIQQTVDFELSGDTLGDAWKNTPWTRLSLRDPGKSKNVTGVKLLYSSKGIYCLFWCEDQKITSTRKEDFTDLFNEDVVEIFFWTEEKHPIYFEYELSPYNKELAILVPNLNGSFMGWRPWNYSGDKLTRRATKIYTEGETVAGWSAEFFIPYTLLRPLANVPPVKGTTWRINTYRIDYDSDTAHWWWQPTSPNFHDYKSFGTLKFD